MPASTARFRFEFRLNDWGERFSTALCGSRCTFFVGFRDDGSVRRVYLGQPDTPFDPAQKAQLAEAYKSWLLYAPFDDEGSAYLEWLHIPQKIAERWLGKRLEPQDFIDVRTTGTREDWPESWRVIIG